MTLITLYALLGDDTRVLATNKVTFIINTYVFLC